MLTTIRPGWANKKDELESPRHRDVSAALDNKRILDPDPDSGTMNPDPYSDRH